MFAAIEPAHDAVRVDERRARKLSSILQLRSAPVLTKTRRAIFLAAFGQIGIAEEAEQIEVFQPHRLVRALVRIGQAPARITELRAERCRFIGRADDDKPNGNAGVLEIFVDLAQLREWLTEERSADVAKPD